MSFIDNVRRRFASVGSEPAFKKDDPRSYGAGVIKRLKLSNSNYGFSTSGKYSYASFKTELNSSDSTMV